MPTPRGTIFPAPDNRFRIALHGSGMTVKARNRFRIALRASGMTTKAGERSTWTEGGA